MNERITTLRKSLKLTQDTFANSIGLRHNYVWMIEKGDRTPSERTLQDICRMFNVSYVWLTTGNGEMFSDVAESSIEAVAKTYNLDEDDKKIITSYLALTPEEREILKKVMKSFFGIKKKPSK